MMRSKVDAVNRLLPGNVHTSAKELKSFICLAQYYARFVPNFAQLAAPIHAAAAGGPKTKGQVVSLKVRAAIASIKAELNSDRVLARPLWDRAFQVEVDAAVHNGVGAILSQESDLGDRRPVAFHAYAFDDPMKRWSTTQAECFGVDEAVKQWRHFLITNPFVTRVVTDHASLRFLLTAKHLSDVLTRMAMRRLHIQPRLA